MLVRIVILVLMAIFYFCYFAKMLSQRKRGIATDQLGKGKAGFVRCIEIALKTVTYVLPLLEIIVILTGAGCSPRWLQVIGVVLTAAGVTAFVLSVTHMKDNWRAGVQREEKTSLVTDGIYAISRNPAFLGFDLMYIGILSSFFTWYLCIITAAAMALFHLQIVNVEEDFLSEAFGDAYTEYRRTVCRYLGRKCLPRRHTSE